MSRRTSSSRLQRAALETSHQRSQRTDPARGSAPQPLRLPLNAKICDCLVCGGNGFPTSRSFPARFRVLVAFSGSKTKLVMLEILCGLIAATGNVGWINGWLVGLELPALECVSDVLSVQRAGGPVPAVHEAPLRKQATITVGGLVLHVELPRRLEGCRWMRRFVAVWCVAATNFRLLGHFPADFTCWWPSAARRRSPACWR